MSYTILGALKWWAREIPEAVALNADGEEISYQQLHHWIYNTASYLEDQGVTAGDRIGLLGGQSLHFYAIALAAQTIGALAVPLNIRFTERELRTALEDTTPTLLFADENYLPLARAAQGEKPGLLPMQAVQALRDTVPSRYPNFEPERNALIALIPTSGTTSKPKFVQFSHDMVVSIALELQLIEPGTRQGRVYQPAPPFSGGYYTTLEYLVLGCSCYLISQFDADAAIRLIEEKRISVFPAATVFMERLAKSPLFEQADLSSIVWTTTGGARVSQSLIKTFRDKGVMLRSLFGQTEAGGAWAATGDALGEELRSGYGGPFTEWRVLNEQGEIRRNGTGQIVLRGPSIARGYWQNPEASAETFKDGWLYTGDLGSIDEGGCLTYMDRLKDLVISGGMNISAAEVEQVISGLPGVIEVAVIAAQDDKFGETPLAVIHAQGEIPVATIIEHCNANLADFKVPRYVALEPEPLPRLASGKIAKRLLREKYQHAHRELPKVR